MLTVDPLLIPSKNVTDYSYLSKLLLSDKSVLFLSDVNLQSVCVWLFCLKSVADNLTFPRLLLNLSKWCCVLCTSPHFEFDDYL